jgi:16S rRNA (guanine527-N7)-methyltransferase
MSNSIINLDPMRAILGEHREKFARFTELLITESQKYNLTRIDSPEQIEIRHFLDSLTGFPVLDALSQKTGKILKILDIGSGAGFPGLVLAIIRPGWKIVSLEATAKKATFQKLVCDDLKLDNVTIISERAESLAHESNYREKFDAATARALAAMPVLAELSLGFVKVGGAALYWKGPSVSDESKTAMNAIGQMGAEIETVYTYTLPTEESEPATLSLVACKKIKPTPGQYPRVFGMIKKKPL